MFTSFCNKFFLSLPLVFEVTWISAALMKPFPSRSTTLKTSTSSSSVSVSFIFVVIKDRNSGMLMVPLPSASTSLINHSSASVGFCPRDRITVPSSFVVRGAVNASLNSAIFGDVVSSQKGIIMSSDGKQRDLSLTCKESDKKRLMQKTLRFSLAHLHQKLLLCSLQAFLLLLSILCVFSLVSSMCCLCCCFFSFDSFCFFCCFWLQEYIDVVFPSFSWSSN